jgi:hypothetical protein
MLKNRRLKMTCKLDKDCVFGGQQPDCDRVQICCKEKLAVKDAEMENLRDYIKFLAKMINEGI